MKYSFIVITILVSGCSNSSIFFEKVEPIYYTTKSEKYNYLNDKKNYQDININKPESSYSTYQTDYDTKIEHDEGPKIYLKVN